VDVKWKEKAVLELSNLYYFEDSSEKGLYKNNFSFSR
jgi:hypothetical protein